MKFLMAACKAAWVCLVLVAPAVHAQTTRSVVDGYEDNIKAASTIGAIGIDVFGEQVNLKDGTTSFSITDVSVPTNHGLRVAFGRSLGINARDYDQYTDFVADGELLGNWKLDAPYIHGVFDEATGWVSSMPNPQQRCSADYARMAPPTRPSRHKNGFNSFDAEQYWAGNQVNIPGQGSEPLLSLPEGRSRPLDGRAYYGTTRSNWRVSCLPNLLNGTGEGFFVVLPDGTKYTFNWISSRRISALEDTVCNRYGCTSGVGMYRREYFIHATRVEDRFGNFVSYTYSASNPRLLTRIESSDGAAIDVAYVGGKVSTVSSGNRIWQYQYADANRTALSAVVLPDQSRWTYGYQNLLSAAQSETKLLWHDCDPTYVDQSQPPTLGQTLTVGHPGGLIGTFKFRKINHGTDNTPGGCYDPDPDRFGDEEVSRTVAAYRVASLYEKTLHGPGIATLTWSYRYFPSWSFTGYVEPNCSTMPCYQTVQTHVSSPGGKLTRYVFGNDYWKNAGQLLEVHVGTATETLRSTYTYFMQSAAGQVFPDQVGFDPNLRNNRLTTEKNRPQFRRWIDQQGVRFTWEVNRDCLLAGAACFDVDARPLSVTKASSLAPARVETTQYHDNESQWVLGQVLRATTRLSTSPTPIETTRTDFHANALPLRRYAFGKVQQTLGYYADGTLATVADGNGNVTTLSQWMRGIPRLTQYPATEDHPGGTSTSASVNEHGWITSVVDENGYPTGYGYDAMGRLSAIVYPAGDTPASNSVTMVFHQIPVSDRGLPAGHWRHDRYEGNRRTHTYYDALWRPVMTLDFDAADGNVQTQTIKRYDADGRLAFQSYPTRHVFDVNQSLPGVWTDHDALDRPWRTRQDSEHGLLTTTTYYDPGFQTRVVNPRGFTTTTGYYAWDEPTYDLPGWIVKDAGNGNDQATQIQRDVFGKALQIRQSGYSNGVLEDRSRFYVYDDYQQLCKTVEPETGATVMDYDAAGNLQWTAAGTGLTNTAPGACDTIAGRDSGRKVTRYYDQRNRLQQLIFPDHRGSQYWRYTPDGLPREIITDNEGQHLGKVINAYTYNKRRLMSGEAVGQAGWYSWGTGYGYDANGNLANNTYATGLIVSYAPNALGQPTAVTSQDGWTYASGVSYHPNGAISQFTYGNGIVHTMAQNARQLPNWVTSSGGVSNYEYHYDANGNVGYIGDHVRGGSYSRWMTYDGLDRMTSVGSASFGGDHWHRLTYDSLDNITSWRLNGAKDFALYVYDAKHRLTSIRDSAGGTVFNLDYDLQGNLASKGDASYAFDFGNRLRGTNQEWYRYDGHGRRVLNWRANEPGVLSLYSQAGQLLYDENYRASGRKASEYIYLAGSLLATRARNIDTGAWPVTFSHTDALGSPVAVTDTAGNVVDRTAYQPWGRPIGKPQYDGIGYTGHMMDSATQLTYMQQRYYDPGIGRFLSVDPVTTDASTGEHFNRYSYTDNNPYSFVDPDGQAKAAVWIVNLVKGGVDKVARISKERAVELRQAGGQELNIQTNRRQLSHQIENAANPGRARRDVAHDLKDGSGKKGLPHYQSDGVRGHTFWGKLSVAAASASAALDQVAEAAEYIPDPVARPAEQSDISRFNNAMGAISEATGISMPNVKMGQDGGFQGVFRVDDRIDSKRLDRELRK